MIQLLLIAVCIVTAVRGDDEDVSVLLTVKSFTIIDSESDAQHRAAEEVHSMLSEDLLELDELTKTAAQDSNENAGYPFRIMMILPPMIVGAVFSALLLACCCAFSCNLLKRQVQVRRHRDVPCEVWTRKVASPQHKLIALFEQLDESDQSVDNPPGFITHASFVKAMSDSAMAGELARLGISHHESHTVFRLIDKNRNGLVSLAEFLEGCMTLGVIDYVPKQQRRW